MTDALVGTFNQEKTLVEAFSMIVKSSQNFVKPCLEALLGPSVQPRQLRATERRRAEREDTGNTEPRHPQHILTPGPTLLEQSLINLFKDFAANLGII